MTVSVAPIARTAARRPRATHHEAAATAMAYAAISAINWSCQPLRTASAFAARTATSMLSLESPTFGSTPSSSSIRVRR